VALPLVMPPVATGLILLKLLGRRGIIGSLLERMGIDVVFTWRAVVAAMVVMSMPLFVRSARAALEEVNVRFENVARTLGASEPRVFFAITLPLAMRGVVGGTVLALARAIGEFGATIVVAGNIPGRTTTLSLAIFGAIELGKDAEAYRLQVLAVAKGETARFDQVLEQYERSPAVTRERMYLDTMGNVYKNSRKVIVDTKNNNSMMYLPLDKLIAAGPQSISMPNDTMTVAPARLPEVQVTPVEDPARARGVR